MNFLMRVFPLFINLNFYIMSNFDFLGSFLGKGSKVNRDGHDMSNKECLSQPFASIVPVAYRQCVPNEHYKCKFGMYTQTAPMREDNFAELKSNLTAVFVPYSSVWRNYFRLTENDRSTRMDAIFNYEETLYSFELLGFVNYILLPMYTLQRVCSYLSSTFADQLDDILIYSGDGDDLLQLYYPNGDKVYPNANVHDLDNSEYHFQGLIQNTLLLPNGSSSCTLSEYLHYVDVFKTTSGSTFCFDAMRLIDNLGIINLIPIFEDAISWWFKHGFGSPVASFNDTFELIEASRANFMQGWWDINCQDLSKQVSILPFVCYRYAIDILFRSNYRMPSTSLLTIDAINNCGQNGNLALSLTEVDNNVWTIDIPERVTARSFKEAMDLSIGFANSSNAHDVTISDLNNLSLFIHLFSLHNALLQPDLFTTAQQSVVSGNIPTSTTSELTTNLIQTIADKSALYRLRQDLLRAGVRREKQMAAVFGVENDSNLYNDVYVLDKSVSSVNIQGLINQAASDVAPLGERAARGNGSAYLDFEFNCKDFGLIFVFSAYTAEMYYENFAIDYFHQLYPSSWFNPKYNHLGLEAVPDSSCSIIVNSEISGDKSVIINHAPKTLGFSSRDWYYKQVTNKVHGLFTNYPLPVHFSDKELYDVKSKSNLFRGNAYFGGYVPTMLDQQLDLFHQYHDLYFNPYMVNNLFTEMFDGFANGDFSYDHFRCIYQFQVHKVSPMPKIGLIKLS